MSIMKPMNWLEEKKKEAMKDDDFIRILVFSDQLGIAALVDMMIEKGYPTSVLCEEIADVWILRFRSKQGSQMRKRIAKVAPTARTLVESELFRLNQFHLIVQDR